MNIKEIINKRCECIKEDITSKIGPCAVSYNIDNDTYSICVSNKDSDDKILYVIFTCTNDDFGCRSFIRSSVKDAFGVCVVINEPIDIQLSMLRTYENIIKPIVLQWWNADEQTCIATEIKNEAKDTDETINTKAA